MRPISKAHARITTAQIAALLRGTSQNAKHWLHDGGGLYLRPNPGTPGGYWVFRYMLNGKSKKIGIGPLTCFGAVEARDKAHEFRIDIRKGGDPQPERRIARAKHHGELRAQAEAISRTFADEAREWIKLQTVSSQTVKNYERWTRAALFSSTAVDDLKPRHIADTLLRMTHGDMKRALNFFANVCGHAVGHERASRGIDKIAVRNLIKHRKPEEDDGEDAESLPWPEVPGVVAKLLANPAPRSQALLMTILSGLRAQEVYGAQWAEFDLDRREWTVPASRMKQRRKHIVPISGAMLGVLNRIEHRTGYLFPGQSGMHVEGGSLRKLLQDDMGYTGRTVRGFRRSLRNWGGEMVAGRNRFAGDVMEACLAHKKAGVEGHYYTATHFPERVTVLDQWGAYCTATHPTVIYPHLAVA